MYQILLSALLGISITFGDNLLDNYDGRFESNHWIGDTTYMTTPEGSVESENLYPARSLVRSLIFPGWGQIYNKSPWWKPVLFAGIEIAGISGWYQWNNKAEKLRLDYEKFADEHWSLYNWFTNTSALQTLIKNELGEEWNSDVQIIGTHHLDIVYNNQLFSSDCLYMEEESFYDDDQCLLPGIEGDPPASAYNSWIVGLLNMDSENDPDSISVIKDRDYYENIGKYDQFVAGWDGILEDYIIQFKDVGDTTEIIISSPLKNDYLNQREDSNEYLNMATYSVSAVMFNHIFSAFEAVWSSTSQSRNNETIETSAKLIYNKYADYGIGGISFSIRF